jgi:hypothetical protein
LKHQITYNSNKEDAFTVYLPTQKIKFTKTEQGLYAFKPMIKKRNNKVALVNTIEENKLFFTQRQYQRAKKARELYHTLGTLSIKDFKNIITMNAIADNPVNTKDIEFALQIFGEDIGSLKGKTTRRKPLPVAQDYIEIPSELTLKQNRCHTMYQQNKSQWTYIPNNSLKKHLLQNCTVCNRQVSEQL